MHDDPVNEHRHADQNQGRAERITKVAAYGIVVAVAFAFVYAVYCVIRAVSSGTGKWHNTGLADWSLLAVTCAYVVATVLQWRVTQGLLRITTSQLEEARRANTLTLRARLFVERTVLVGDLGPDARVKARVRNYGKIPAIGVLPIVNVEVAEALRSIQPKDSAAQGSRFIAAGRSDDFYRTLYGVRPDQFDEIKAGRAVLLVSLRLKYTDDLKTDGDTICPMFYVLATDTRPAHFAEMLGGSVS